MDELSLSTFCLLNGIAPAFYLLYHLYYLSGDKHMIMSFTLNKPRNLPWIPTACLFPSFIPFLHVPILQNSSKEFWVVSAGRKHSIIYTTIQFVPHRQRDFAVLSGLRSLGAQNSYGQVDFLSSSLTRILFFLSLSNIGP